MLNTPKEDNIKNLLRKKNLAEPKLNYFKGHKLVKEDNIRSIHLYSYKDKNKQNTSMTPQRDRTPNRTPNKLSNRTPNKTINKTPTKDEGGKSYFAATTKKFPITKDEGQKTTPGNKIWKV